MAVEQDEEVRITTIAQTTIIIKASIKITIITTRH